MQMSPPLAYHQATVTMLRERTPASLRSLLADRDVIDPDLDEALLRNTYRLEEASHPELHAAGRRAAEALGLDMPIEYFQAGSDGRSNASLLHQSDRAVLLFEGPLLDRLSTPEMQAVCGHELAHRLLWQTDGGSHLATDRLLDAAVNDARTPAHYLETQRRWSMACELFSDRGALVACGDLAVTVSTLLKLETGLAQVDPAAYLRQAGQVDLSSGSRGTSHPEGVARAWALQRWINGEDSEVLLSGPLDVESPDLLDAQTLRDLTAFFAAQVATTPGLDSAVVRETATNFTDPPAPLSPTMSPLPRFDEPLRSALDDGSLAPARAVAASTRRYLSYVLLDLATADDELGDDALVAALRLAETCGLDTFDDIAADELGWTDRRKAALQRSASKGAEVR